jgi:hypothetical protein
MVWLRQGYWYAFCVTYRHRCVKWNFVGTCSSCCWAISLLSICAVDTCGIIPPLQDQDACCGEYCVAVTPWHPVTSDSITFRAVSGTRRLRQEAQLQDKKPGAALTSKQFWERSHWQRKFSPILFITVLLRCRWKIRKTSIHLWWRSQKLSPWPRASRPGMSVSP